MSRRSPPVALTVAGSDSGGGAGIQADLKTFAAHGVYGVSVVTLVTAQNTLGVHATHVIPPEVVAAQLQAVLDDFPVAVVKTGALGTADTVRAVAGILGDAGLPLIVDPVLRSTGGRPLLAADALRAVREDLVPLASLVTPNLPEAEELLGLGAGTLLSEAAREALLARVPFPVLLKGGHAAGDVVRDDLRVGHVRAMFSARRWESRHTHGTGCTLASAIAANVALGFPLMEAVRRAHAYLQRALRAAPALGRGNGPLGHFPDAPRHGSARTHRDHHPTTTE